MSIIGTNGVFPSDLEIIEYCKSIRETVSLDQLTAIILLNDIRGYYKSMQDSIRRIKESESMRGAYVGDLCKEINSMKVELDNLRTENEDLKKSKRTERAAIAFEICSFNKTHSRQSQKNIILSILDRIGFTLTKDGKPELKTGQASF